MIAKFSGALGTAHVLGEQLKESSVRTHTGDGLTFQRRAKPPGSCNRVSSDSVGPLQRRQPT